MKGKIIVVGKFQRRLRTDFLSGDARKTVLWSKVTPHFRLSGLLLWENLSVRARQGGCFEKGEIYRTEETLKRTGDLLPHKERYMREIVDYYAD